MENLNVNQEMNFDEMAEVVGDTENYALCRDLTSQMRSLMTNDSSGDWEGIMSSIISIKNIMASEHCGGIYTYDHLMP